MNLNGGGELPYPIIAMACHGDADGLRLLIGASVDVNKTGGKWYSALQASFCDDSDSKSQIIILPSPIPAHIIMSTVISPPSPNAAKA